VHLLLYRQGKPPHHRAGARCLTASRRLRRWAEEFLVGTGVSAAALILGFSNVMGIREPQVLDHLATDLPQDLFPLLFPAGSPATEGFRLSEDYD